jgi:hypothetical protein
VKVWKRKALNTDEESEPGLQKEEDWEENCLFVIVVLKLEMR